MLCSLLYQTRMFTLHLLSTLLVAGALVGNASEAKQSAPPPSFERAAWKAEFERVKIGLAQGYANLDWQVDRRGLNLQRVSEQIHAMLDRANSDVEAVVVLTKLIHAFKDPHLQLQIGSPPENATLLPRKGNVEASAPSGECCSAAHSSAGKGETRLPYPQVTGWKQISRGPFLSGVLGDVGFLRTTRCDDSWLRAQTFERAHPLNECQHGR